MALIKNVERAFSVNTGYGLSDLLNYMAGSQIASTTEITVISQGTGAPDPTYLWRYGASSGGSFYTGKTATLDTTINASALIIEALPGSLATWPGTGYIYFISPAEGIFYSSINPSTTSASGNDEFVIASVADRGWSGSASSHTAPVAINEIAVWFVQSINYDTVGTFNFSYFAREAYRVGYQAPDIPGNVYSQDRSLSGAFFSAYELIQESAT